MHTIVRRGFFSSIRLVGLNENERLLKENTSQDAMIDGAISFDRLSSSIY